MHNNNKAKINQINESLLNLIQLYVVLKYYRSIIQLALESFYYNY